MIWHKSPDNYKINARRTNQLNRIIINLRATIYAELKTLHAYLIKDKKIGQNYLWNIKQLMDEGVFDALRDIVQYDFSEAGKCILFDRPTAAAFHALRGTEGALYWFYELTTSNQRTTEMWAEIVDNLRNVDFSTSK